MLDDFIIDEVLEWEKKKRKEAEWQPEPLYLPIDTPRPSPEDAELPDDENRGVIVIDCYSSVNDRYIL